MLYLLQALRLITVSLELLNMARFESFQSLHHISERTLRPQNFVRVKCCDRSRGGDHIIHAELFCVYKEKGGGG